MSEGLHPYFHVYGAERWYGHLPEALAAARASGRKLLVVSGRPTCNGTRALVEKTISKEEIAEYLNVHFVALAVDAQAPEADVAALLAGLPRHEPTPVCAYLAADGRVVHSTAGGRPAAVFLNDMLEATVKK